MISKRQLAHLKVVIELEQQKEIEVKIKILIKRNISVKLRNKPTKQSNIPEKYIHQQKKVNWERKYDSEDGVGTKNNNKDCLNIEELVELMGGVQDSSNFEKY